MFIIKNEKKLINIALISIMAIFFGISVYVVLKHGNYFLLGSLDQMNNDDVKYIRSAQVLLSDHRLVYGFADQPTVFIMPGLPLVLAAFFKIFGLSAGLDAFRVFQVLLHTLGIFLIFLIARDIFNRRVAIIACLLYALYIPGISNTGLILTEEIFMFLLLALVYVSLLALRTKKMGFYIAGGLLWGIACLFRPTVAPYPIVILIMWLIKKYTFKEMLKFTIVTALMFIIVMSPWWIRNYSTFDRFIPLTQSSGNPFFQGTYVNYDESKDPPQYPVFNNEMQKDKFEMDTGMKRLRKGFSENPVEYIYWYTLGKTYYAWYSPYYYKAVLGVTWNPVYFWHKLVICICILGMILVVMKRKMHRDCMLPIITVLFFNTAYLPFFTSSRYAYPLYPLMFILGAYFVEEIIQYFISRSKKAASRISHKLLL
ncbi:MAG: glycosyltransferase family 39 protein [Bacillota bacterium]|nr:glycosyltransferase family 39 protein [Bacillota bacterium]